MAESGPVSLPKSVTPAGVAWASVISFFGSVGFVYQFRPFEDIVASALFVIGVMAVVTFATDVLVYRVHRNASTGMDWGRVKPSLKRGLVKLLGLYVAVGIIGFLYAVLPVYEDGLYETYMRLVSAVALPFLLLAVPYVFWVDSHQIAPEDGYWHMGNLVLLRWEVADVAAAWAMMRGWIVKGFFLPLMFSYFCGSLQDVMTVDFSTFVSFVEVYGFLYTFAFFFDLSIAAVGYMTTFRPLDTHIRSTEPTALGWAVCIICYAPFWSFFTSNYVTYDDGLEWGKWLWENPLAYGIWGVSILLCLSVYIYAMAQFGCRFSNLTHRGIITSGPYRWTKHPAYVFKNLSWWLIAIPFIPGDGQWQTAVQNCFLLACVNGIYFLRAKTEERHLMRDPEYAAYVRWIEANGIFRWLPRGPGRAAGVAQV